MAHHMGHIVNGLVSRMVQRHQIPVPLEHIQSGFAIITDMRADQTMPRVVGRIQASGGLVKRRLNGRMIAAHVIEHAIRHHLQSHVPADRDKLIERGIPAQSHIDMHMVERVVSMRRRLEHRTQQQAGRA